MSLYNKKKMLLNEYNCELECGATAEAIKELCLARDSNLYIDLNEQQISELIYELCVH